METISRVFGHYGELYPKSFEHHKEKYRGIAVPTNFHFFDPRTALRTSGKKRPVTFKILS